MTVVELESSSDFRERVKYVSFKHELDAYRETRSRHCLVSSQNTSSGQQTVCSLRCGKHDWGRGREVSMRRTGWGHSEVSRSREQNEMSIPFFPPRVRLVWNCRRHMPIHGTKFVTNNAFSW